MWAVSRFALSIAESSPPVGTRHFHIKENRVRLFHDGLGYSFAGVLSFRHSPLRK